jgi:hypothetical protein
MYSFSLKILFCLRTAFPNTLEPLFSVGSDTSQVAADKNPILWEWKSEDYFD